MNMRLIRLHLFSRSYPILFFMLISTGLFAATPVNDTSGKLLLAALNKKDKPGYFTKEANVVFPEVLSDNKEQSVDYIENFANNRREYIIRTYKRSKKYFTKVIIILKKYNLPNELTVLMALESAFKANAVSKAGAVGYWQFMDEVGKEYGLKVVAHLSADEKKKLIKKDKKKAIEIIKKMAKGKDDRQNFSKSTYAAARYLKDRGRNLNNDILLMVASYNCGIGNVWNAIASSGKKNSTFWDIKDYLPAETRAYVMNFITLNVIFSNYDKFADNTLAFKPVKVKLDNSTQYNMREGLDETRSASGNNKD